MNINRAVVYKPTRRSFLQSGVAAIVLPAIVPASVFGSHAAGNRLRIGCIGVGRRGRQLLGPCIAQGLTRNARVVAVCDVDAHRVRSAKESIERTYVERLENTTSYECAGYTDYRELLERDDLDGVMINTPEHWHALMAVAAARAGKDMYIEKPLTYGVAEGRAVVEAVRENHRVVQVGSQQRSCARFRLACELVRNGRLGKLHTIVSQMPEDRGTGRTETMPVPENLRYDLWLGPTPEKPYTEDRVHPQRGMGRPGWLQIEHYSRGTITGWGTHTNDIAQWGNGSDETTITEVEGSAEYPDRGLFDVHTTFEARGVYPNGVKLIQKTGAPGTRFLGDEGAIWVDRRAIRSEPAGIVRQRPADAEIHLYESNDHMGNFLDCMRSRKDPVAPVEVGHRSNTICLITHIAMRLGRKLQFDPAAERFVNDEQANAMLDYTYRLPTTGPSAGNMPASDSSTRRG